MSRIKFKSEIELELKGKKISVVFTEQDTWWLEAAHGADLTKAEIAESTFKRIMVDFL